MVNSVVGEQVVVMVFKDELCQKTVAGAGWKSHGGADQSPRADDKVALEWLPESHLIGRTCIHLAALACSFGPPESSAFTPTFSSTTFWTTEKTWPDTKTVKASYPMRQLIINCVDTSNLVKSTGRSVGDPVTTRTTIAPGHGIQRSSYCRFLALSFVNPSTFYGQKPECEDHDT